MRTLRLCSGGRPVAVPDEAAVRRAAERRELLWLDVVDPTEGDAALLEELFGFHPLALEDAIRARQRTKIERYADHYFVVFYAARFLPESTELELHPIHLFIGPTYLVTMHGGGTGYVQETMRRWTAPAAPFGAGVGGLVHALLDAIIDDYFPVTDEISERTEAVEDAIFAPDQTSITPTVFALKKVLLEFRRVLAPGREVLNTLLRRELPVVGADDAAYFQDLYDHTVRLTENVDLYRDFLSSALDSHLSFQSNRLNEILKVLTVASILLMANALIAGIYGMNFRVMPELEWGLGYPFALGLMAAVTAGLILFFRRKGWV